MKELIKKVLALLQDKGFAEDLCEFSIKAIDDKIKFDDAIKKFLNTIGDNIIKEQMECLLEQIMSELKKNINDSNLSVFQQLDECMDEEMERGEIPEERRESMKANLNAWILHYISKKDINFYNDLLQKMHVEKELGELYKKINSLDRKQDSVDQKYDTLFCMFLKIQENIKEYNADHSPLRMFSDTLCLNSPEKLISRDQEKADIQRSFDGGSHVVFLSGRPGMGKTTLAGQYANSCGCTKIYFQKYEESMEYTVSRLGKGGSNGRMKGDEILSYWESLDPKERKSVLLVIDNFNADTLQNGDEQHYTAQVHGEFFKRLKNVGIHVLITTRIHLLSESSIEVGAVKDTMELFEKYYGEALTEEQQILVRELIEIVQGNTLLIAQSANIWKQSDSERQKRLVEQLRDCQLKQNHIELDEKTLYEQVRSLLDFSGICSDPRTKGTFASAALMPLKGMSRDRFIKMSGCDMNQLNRLINGSWVLLDSDKNISMHPVVKEIAVQEHLVTFENCKQTCEYIMDALDLELPLADRYPYTDCAWEIYKIFGSKDRLEDGSVNHLNKIMIRIFYRLSDIYDNLEEHERSMELINTIDKNIQDLDLDVVERAQMLSGTAYSINNFFRNMDELDRAADLLQKAREILSAIPENRRNELEVKRVKAQIMSDMGSNHLAKSKCSQMERTRYLQNALEWHKKALAFRRNRLDDEEEEDEKLINVLKLSVAVSYTTVATDYFYMGNYDKAIQMHKKAYEIRQELNEDKAVINQQGIIGSVLEVYRRHLDINESDWRLILDYYPSLLKVNDYYKNEKALKTNIRYFKDIIKIIQNDRRLEKYTDEVMDKKQQISDLAWDVENFKKVFENLIWEQ